MSTLFRLGYNLAMVAFAGLLGTGGLFNAKLRAGHSGRKGWRKKLESFRSAHPGHLVWIHCASLGEFEMARPLIEALNKGSFQNLNLLVTFFSPSGYEPRKTFSEVQGVFYLPVDTMRNARDFVKIVRPDLAIFVKYEFWINYLLVLKAQGVKTILINGVFRRDQVFFRWYGGLFRDALQSFHHFFVQNRESQSCLNFLGLDNVTVTGDLRFDRVMAIASHPKEFPLLNKFREGVFVLAGGSTWPPEEALIRESLSDCGSGMRILLAPHDIRESNLNRIEHLFSEFSVIRYSRMQEGDQPDVVLLDTIGDLSSVYGICHAAFVGGGFSGALHNILEPAVFGIPVFFGPENKRFAEAAYFVKSGIGFEVERAEQLTGLLDRFMKDPGERENVSDAGRRIFKANAGGIEQVYYKIKGYLSEL